jgi:hemerythrin-like domain-containing protein
MKNCRQKDRSLLETTENKRREFLKKGLFLGTITGMAGYNLIACKGQEEEEVTPGEDLMREHGLLDRILLIYDTCRSHLAGNEAFPVDMLFDAAQIIRSFVEDYHEKLEEDHLFPRFEKANQLTGLVKVLRMQHQTGRTLTDQIIQFRGNAFPSDGGEAQRLIRLLHDFNWMYRPHKSREDTVLFPAMQNILSRNEYFDLGEEFEMKEHELFGEDGFEAMVEKVAGIEKQLGIYELSQFMPRA